MKVFKKLSILFIILLFVSGCSFQEKTMEGINIYTTTYPIQFLIQNLYKDHAKVYSIYPTGVKIDEYELSDRKLEEYSKSDLFVFNSKDKDIQYAKKMRNLNEDLKIIDVSGENMDIEYSIEELWLIPNKYLKMAENLKDGLSEYINNPYLVEEINDNFDELEYEISKLDASFTDLIDNSNYDVIVADNDLFKFLEKYGLKHKIKVISLEENDDLSINKLDEVKDLIKNNKIKYIYSIETTSNDTVNSLINEYDIDLITLNAMHSIDGGITNSNDNYLTIMTNNITELKRELYK